MSSTIPTGLGPAPVTMAPSSPLRDDANNTECRLLGPFAIFVQLALGGLALLSLVFKRWYERPQRPVKIWFFDASKQVFGSALVHVANVFMSMLTSGRFSIKAEPATVVTVAARSLASLVLGRRSHAGDYMPNPCSFYLLNLAIDTTLGIPILIGLVRLTTRLVSWTSMGKPIESIQSGNYGHPPNVCWWLKQSVIYFCGLMGMKICVLFMFMVMPWISHVGDWALQWTEGNEKLQIVFSMMLFPLIMNALQYYIIDSFIKKKDQSGPYAPVVVAHEEIGPGGRPRNLYEALTVVDGDGDISDGEFKPSTPGRRRSRQYDPASDDDGPAPTRPRSRSRKSRALPKEFYPAE